MSPRRGGLMGGTGRHASRRLLQAPPSSCALTYSTVDGDTCLAVARAFQVPVSQLIEVNSGNVLAAECTDSQYGSRLSAGNTICIVAISQDEYSIAQQLSYLAPEVAERYNSYAAAPQSAELREEFWDAIKTTILQPRGTEFISQLDRFNADGFADEQHVLSANRPVECAQYREVDALPPAIVACYCDPLQEYLVCAMMLQDHLQAQDLTILLSPPAATRAPSSTSRHVQSGEAKRQDVAPPAPLHAVPSSMVPNGSDPRQLGADWQCSINWKALNRGCFRGDCSVPIFKEPPLTVQFAVKGSMCNNEIVQTTAKEVLVWVAGHDIPDLVVSRLDFAYLDMLLKTNFGITLDVCLKIDGLSDFLSKFLGIDLCAGFEFKQFPGQALVQYGMFLQIFFLKLWVGAKSLYQPPTYGERPMHTWMCNKSPWQEHFGCQDFCQMHQQGVDTLFGVDLSIKVLWFTRSLLSKYWGLDQCQTQPRQAPLADDANYSDDGPFRCHMLTQSQRDAILAGDMDEEGACTDSGGVFTLGSNRGYAGCGSCNCCRENRAACSLYGGCAGPVDVTIATAQAAHASCVDGATGGEALTLQACRATPSQVFTIVTPSASSTWSTIADPDGRCWEAADFSADAPSPITTRPCTDALSQQFRLAESTTRGVVTISPRSAPNMCADLAGSSAADGAAIVQRGCSGAETQQYYVHQYTSPPAAPLPPPPRPPPPPPAGVPLADVNYVTLFTMATDAAGCIGNSCGVVGTSICQAPCPSGPNYVRTNLEASAEGYRWYSIAVEMPAQLQCWAALPPGSAAATDLASLGAVAVVSCSSQRSEQQFAFVQAPGGGRKHDRGPPTYDMFIVVRASGMCLSVAGGSGEQDGAAAIDGALLMQAPCDGTRRQLFRMKVSF